MEKKCCIVIRRSLAGACLSCQAVSAMHRVCDSRTAGGSSSRLGSREAGGASHAPISRQEPGRRPQS